jgi:hypothetical protein
MIFETVFVDTVNRAKHNGDRAISLNICEISTTKRRVSKADRSLQIDDRGVDTGDREKNFSVV